MELSNEIISSIEPKILPLVIAVNDTSILRTVSSCQGHFEQSDQMEFFDRNFADVRCVAAENVPETEVEELIVFLLSEYIRVDLSIGTPIHLEITRLFVPIQWLGERCVYVIKICPKARFDAPDRKREDTDEAIDTITGLVKKYMELKANGWKQKPIAIDMNAPEMKDIIEMYGNNILWDV